MDKATAKLSQCAGKTAYATFQAAAKAIEYRKRPYKGRFQAYKCQFCSAFHVGSSLRGSKE